MLFDDLKLKLHFEFPEEEETYQGNLTAKNMENFMQKFKASQPKCGIEGIQYNKDKAQFYKSQKMKYKDLL